jgi:hypothetical protein
MRIAGHGRSVDVPRGWEARIYQRPGAAPVLHVATVLLRDDDGDFGAAATARMRPDDMFAALLEFRGDDRVTPGVGLFAAARMGPLRAPEFAPNQLQVTRPGQLGRQRSFTQAGRPFCLYAVIAPGHKRAALLAGELGAVLATVRLPPD